MDILQAARQLRPGTAWNFSNGVLGQAIDGTPRVQVPTMAELQAVIDSNPTIPEKKQWQDVRAGSQAQAIAFLAKKLGLE